MRILYLSSNRLPTEKANGYQIIKTCEALVKSGAEVNLVVPRRFNSIKESSFSFYALKQSFEVTYLPCLDLIPLDFVLGRLANWITVCSFLLAFKLFSFLQKYDVLYTREELIGLFFKNFILELHTLPKKITPLYRFIWQRTRKIIAITTPIKAHLVAAGIDSEKIFVSPDAVDLEDFANLPDSEEARRQLGLPLNKKLIGYTGKFSTMGISKGTELFLEVASLVKDKDIAFVLVGGSLTEINSLKEQAQQLGIEDKFILISSQPRQRALLYLKAADVLVMPYPDLPFYRYYTSPLKLFEYMAAGKPIVASDLPALRDILNEKNSVLFRPEDPVALARGIEIVLADRELAKRISERALQEVQKFTWKKRGEQILNLCE